jgi:hypothetical protein
LYILSGQCGVDRYLITVKRPWEKYLVKTVAVDKNLSQDGIRALLRTEANDFIDENFKSIGDLNGMSVHAEKAKGLIVQQEKEFQNQVKSLGTDNSMRFTKYETVWLQEAGFFSGILCSITFN